MKENANLSGILLVPGSIKSSFEITETGIFDTTELPAIDPGKAFYSFCAKVDNEFYQQLQHCLALVVDEDISVETVEALIVSNWENAKWIVPGRILLKEDAYLDGPWRLTLELRKKLGLKGQYIYLLKCPPSRFPNPVPSKILDTNPVLNAYSAGEPYDLEREAIDGLLAIASRVSGELLVPGEAHTSGNAQLIKPDPLEKIDLHIYAQAWLKETRMSQLLECLFGSQTTDDEHIEIIADEVGDELKDRGYRISLQVNKNIFIVIEVQSGEDVNRYLPPVLRFVPDKQTAFARYTIRFQVLPPAMVNCADDIFGYAHKLPSRRQRKNRLLAKTYIEKIAIMLNQILGGYILDEDGFLLDHPK